MHLTFKTCHQNAASKETGVIVVKVLKYYITPCRLIHCMNRCLVLNISYLCYSKETFVVKYISTLYFTWRFPCELRWIFLILVFPSQLYLCICEHRRRLDPIPANIVTAPLCLPIHVFHGCINRTGYTARGSNAPVIFLFQYNFIIILTAVMLLMLNTFVCYVRETSRLAFSVRFSPRLLLWNICRYVLSGTAVQP